MEYNGTLPAYYNFAKEIFLYEDWIQNASTGALGWNNTTASSGTVVMSTNVSPTVVGNVNLLTSTTASGRAGIALGTASMTFGGGRCIITWLCKLSRLSDAGSAYTAYIGYGNNGTAPTAGVYFSYAHGTNGGNWVLNATDASSNTPTNSSTAADTSWHKFTIDINAAATSAEFFIDGVSQGTVASNIPQAAGATHTCSPQCAIVNSGAAHASSSEMWIDAMQMYQLLTSQR